VVAVTVVATAVTAVLVVGQIAVQPERCCVGSHPIMSSYGRELSRVDTILVQGDGQTFGALAQDPLLRHPERADGGAVEYSYRAQRPVWAVLAWAGSAGQPGLVGWVLALLTVVSAGAVVAGIALLLAQRGASPWWALGALVFGAESIFEFTPELLAFAFAAFAILAWQRRRPASATTLFCLAALTRETMLLVVVVLALWSLVNETPRWSVRRVVPLATPFAVYAAWATVLRVRLGYFPNHSRDRLGLPTRGFFDALRVSTAPNVIALWVLLGLALTIVALVARRHDLLTWVMVAFAGFATLFGSDVWLANYGFVRALFPLFACSCVIVGATLEHWWRARTASVDPEQRGQEAPGVALGRLGHVFGGAFDEDLPATVAALGAEVDDPVR
jgi:hypothetical protein